MPVTAETSTSELIKRLRSAGMTKYGIAKTLGVAWQTVHVWERGLTSGNKEHRQMLEKLLKEKEGNPVS